MVIHDTSSTENISTLPTTASGINGSTSVLPSDDTDIDKENHTLRYLIIPICALGLVVLLTIVVLWFLRKKRLARLRHHLIPFYNFDPGEEEWETELLEDRRDTSSMKGYKTMEHESSIHETYLSSKIH